MVSRSSGEDRRGGTVAEFMGCLAAALGAPGTLPQAKAVATLIEAALRTDALPESCQAQRLSVCEHVSPALAAARAHGGHLSRVAESFAAIEPRFRWAPRATGGPFASANWPQGHANAVIVGEGGLERRQGIRIGVSLMAPHVRYPDHTHPPEEVYLVLSPGRFKHGSSSWCEPGAGGTFHNEPGIWHAMASGDAPFLAIWSLWGGAASGS